MSDDADRASELEQAERDEALRDHRRRSGVAGKTMADSATECPCGEEIPVARRAAVPGCVLCVVCKGREERLLRGGHDVRG